jgi:hypothetical protein
MRTINHLNRWQLDLMASAIALIIIPQIAIAGPPLETETARLLNAGTFEIQTAVEYQTSKNNGDEYAFPLEFEYGITDDLQLLVEPVAYTAILPKVGHDSTGFGDIETTLFYRFLDEKPYAPALAIAGEIKFPTANSNQIGTGEFDYTPYLVASKKFGAFDTHLNIGYSFIGAPSGTKVRNTFNYAFATEYYLSEGLQLVAEIVGNTSAAKGSNEGDTGGVPVPPGVGQPPPPPPSGETPDSLNLRGADQPDSTGSPVSAEIAGKEVAGLLGFRYYVTPSFNVSFGLVYDNQHAVTYRPGLAYSF